MSTDFNQFRGDPLKRLFRFSCGISLELYMSYVLGPYCSSSNSVEIRRKLIMNDAFTLGITWDRRYRTEIMRHVSVAYLTVFLLCPKLLLS